MAIRPEPSINPQPLHIVEPTLVDVTGHCFSFLDSLCRVSSDYPITVWGARDARVTFPAHVVVKRFFTRRLRRLQAWWLYRRLLRQPVRLFVSTAGRSDLMLLDWASRGPILPGRVFLYVHWFRASPTKQRQLSRLAARQPEIVVLAPTDSVVDVFRAAGFRHVTRVPYPMSPSGEPLSEDGGGTFRHVLYAGAARRDKGFAEVVSFVQRLAGSGEDIPVRLQTSAQHYDKTDDVVAASLRRLEELSYPYLERFPRTLAPAEYAALYRGAVCLQLYARADFADRVSGVTLDAFSNGSPIVTVRGTWMARVALEFGAGVVIDEPTPDQILAAVKTLVGAYADYHARARDAGRELRRRHDPGALFRAVTA